MPRTIRQLVDRFYAIENGAEGDFSEIFRDDFVMGIMKGFPHGGDHKGLDATKQFMADCGALFDFWAVDPDRFIEVDPQHIIVSGKYRSRAKSTGRDFEMETIHLWTAENGMLTRFNHYCDTAIVSAALEHRVPQYPDKCRIDTCWRRRR